MTAAATPALFRIKAVGSGTKFDGTYVTVTDINFGNTVAQLGSSTGDTFFLDSSCHLFDSSGNYAGQTAETDNFYDPEAMYFESGDGIRFPQLSCSIDGTFRLHCQSTTGNVFSVYTGVYDYDGEKGQPGTLDIGSKAAIPGSLVRPLVVPV